MHYPNVTSAVFLSRPNRFVAQVLLEGEVITVHVKNTGRCRELLLPGAQVWLTKSTNPNRKTAYDLIAVQKGARLINMDAQAPNQVFYEWAAAGHFVPQLTLLKPECRHGDSRFDFYWEAGPRKGFVEVKGVTLERDGAAYFPGRPHPAGHKASPRPDRQFGPRLWRGPYASSFKWSRRTFSPPTTTPTPPLDKLCARRPRRGLPFWPAAVPSPRTV